ncbi:MAG: hypothetical protein HY909_16610 [Deltaproteobacteria bacterium]|nr:hypothetical protein [Deltaproteobacteria bacterium]
MARRHLPVVNSPPPRAPDPPSEGAPSEPPPWHWVPLGTVVSVVAFARLAPGVVWLLRALLGSAPRAGAGVAALAGALSLAAMLLSIALGGFVLGRYGPETNPRHGTLSGACTAALLWAVTGRAWFLLALVPLGMLVGWAGALGGVRARKNRWTEGV